jgi:hypothetical protein
MTGKDRKAYAKMNRRMLQKIFTNLGTVVVVMALFFGAYALCAAANNAPVRGHAVKMTPSEHAQYLRDLKNLYGVTP